MALMHQLIPGRRAYGAYLRLSEMARELGPGERLPTVNVLCVVLKVSRSTLDTALKAAEAEGVLVKRHGSGIYTPTRREGTLVPILMGIDPEEPGVSPFYRLLGEAVRVEAKARGLEAEVFAGFTSRWPASAKMKPLRELTREKAVYGALRVTGSQALEDQLSAETAFVHVDSWPGRGWRVGANLMGMARQGVELLRARGAEKLLVIAHWPGMEVLRDGSARVPSEGFEGVLKVLRPSAWFKGGEVMMEQAGEAIGKEIAWRLSKRGGWGRIDGLVMTDDMVARGVLTVLSRAGIYAGRDVAVASHMNRGASTLAGFERDIVGLALEPRDFARALMAMLESQRKNEAQVKRVLIGPTIEKNGARR